MLTWREHTDMYETRVFLWWMCAKIVCNYACSRAPLLPGTSVLTSQPASYYTLGTACTIACYTNLSSILTLGAHAYEGYSTHFVCVFRVCCLHFTFIHQIWHTILLFACLFTVVIQLCILQVFERILYEAPLCAESATTFPQSSLRL